MPSRLWFLENGTVLDSEDYDTSLYGGDMYGCNDFNYRGQHPIRIYNDLGGSFVVVKRCDFNQIPDCISDALKFKHMKQNEYVYIIPIKN
jgi:hypothetical protein